MDQDVPPHDTTPRATALTAWALARRVLSQRIDRLFLMLPCVGSASLRFCYPFGVRWLRVPRQMANA
jgi:hypothetical protein